MRKGSEGQKQSRSWPRQTPSYFIRSFLTASSLASPAAASGTAAAKNRPTAKGGCVSSHDGTPARDRFQWECRPQAWQA